MSEYVYRSNVFYTLLCHVEFFSWISFSYALMERIIEYKVRWNKDTLLIQGMFSIFQFPCRKSCSKCCCDDVGVLNIYVWSFRRESSAAAVAMANLITNIAFSKAIPIHVLWLLRNWKVDNDNVDRAREPRINSPGILLSKSTYWISYSR